ncbi:MAG: DUF1330 domain-containing protein [Rhodoferax sp.]|nr:DUF1330 domain-containing protein [Rhodoferax sp.]
MSTNSPNAQALAALAASPDSGPVVMLNLLKFKPGGGARAYGRYSEAFQALLERHGGRFIYLGRGAEVLVGDQSWDAVALVEYPSRAVFLRIIALPDYAAIAQVREDGLERTMLLATTPRVAAVSAP